MILQALYEYYQRKPDFPSLGFEEKEIPFLIVLDDQGKFFQIEPTSEGQGKNKTVQKFLVPQSVKKSVNILPNLLWDNASYVLGLDKKGKPDRLAEQVQAFQKAISNLKIQGDSGIDAVLKFLNTPEEINKAKQVAAQWPEIIEKGANLSFRLRGHPELVCQSESVRAVQAKRATGADGEAAGICLVSGEEDTTERLHAAIKGVWGAQSVGANIVSFQKNMGFDSYDKEQGYNAPVGKRAAFAYTTALNHLLAKNSKQRLQIGDASTVFWAEKGNNRLEAAFADFFTDNADALENAVESLNPPSDDDPDRNTTAVASTYNAPYTGATVFDDDGTLFYVLGLSPNAARISVRFWHMDTVGNLARSIKQHFKDLEIIHDGRSKTPYLPLRRLLNSTAPATATHPFGDPERIPPNLAGDTMRSVLDARQPYPETLLQAAIRRIRAEQARKDKNGKPTPHVTYERAALIKALLNRKIRLSKTKQQQELTMALDETNTNIGYRLGRLFAALEKIQQDAAGRQAKINATIRDRYYGAASSTPLAVFPTLLKLSSHHQSTLRKEKPGLFVDRDKLLSQILHEGIDGEIGFPPILSLENQGKFAIGYYHQRQAFFPKH